MGRCRCNEPERGANWNLSGCEELRQLKVDLEIAKRLSTSEGLRDFLNNEDHKNKLRKLRDDQHVNSYKLERDGLRKQIELLKKVIGDLMVQYEIPASDELKRIVG